MKTTDRLEAIGFIFSYLQLKARVTLYFRKSLQTTSASRKSLQTTSALSATSNQCFEQPAASCLVCSLIFIEFHSTVTYGQMLILLFFYAISNFNWPALTPILSVLPATKSPLRRSSANLSSTSVCRVLRSGRAPISGSYP
ncbi:S1 RNA-binding domain-containing protein [Streptococcus pneumoniae]|nr:S1 RNA-binding domain-containing protein [Streptococcus pneumoniae]